MGIGVSCYVEITAGPVAGREDGEVRIRPDGTVLVLTGSSAHGQGHHTAFAQLVAAQTGIPMERIEVVHGDTALVPRGVGTFGSRSLQLGGAAIHTATVALVDAGRAAAADLLGVEPEVVQLDAECGCFCVPGRPQDQRSWAEVAAAIDPAEGMVEHAQFSAPFPTFPFGAHVAVVEVDTATGKVTLVRHVACDDAGTILNPMLAEGQRHGGIAQGAAQALCEEVLYDGDGNPITSNLADYGCISAAELPDFELVDLATPTTANPLGAKGIGESGTIGATPAVLSAVIDALAPLGVRHLDMPATPQKVWAAIQAARRGDDGVRIGATP
jgi:carbon-monoxide dehydrogenase large subunit